MLLNTKYRDGPDLQELCMKVLSLSGLMIAIIMCSSCINGNLKKRHIEPLTFSKNLSAGHYVFCFDYLEGDLVEGPVVTLNTYKNSKLKSPGKIQVTLNGSSLWEEENSFFFIRGSEKHPEWRLTMGTIPDDGEVQVVVSGEVSILLNDRGLRFRRSVK